MNESFDAEFSLQQLERSLKNYGRNRSVYAKQNHCVFEAKGVCIFVAKGVCISVAKLLCILAKQCVGKGGPTLERPSNTAWRRSVVNGASALSYCGRRGSSLGMN